MGPEFDASASSQLEPSSISTTLLEQVRKRQPDAWRRLVNLYGPVVYRWCRRLGLADADAADAVQEVFAAVAAHVAEFRRDREEDSFGAWLRTITRNKVRDHFRRGCDQPAAKGGTDAYEQMLDLSASQEESLLRTSGLGPDRQFLHRALEVVRAEFENSTWEAFCRVVVESQSPTEAAQAMGLSVHAVYMAKSRVLKRLRQILGDASGNVP